MTVEIFHPDQNAFLKKITFSDEMEPYLEAIYQKSPDAYSHTLRVARLSLDLAHVNLLPYPDVVLLCYSALLHDIGKTLTPKEILEKPASLDAAEKRAMRGHVRLGFLLIQGFEEDIRKIVAESHEYQADSYPRSHIKRRDSERGTPERRTEEPRIDNLAQIVAISDTYDALTSSRAYKQALSKAEAEAAMRAQYLGNPVYIDQIMKLGYKNLPHAEPCG